MTKLSLFECFCWVNHWGTFIQNTFAWHMVSPPLSYLFFWLTFYPNELFYNLWTFFLIHNWHYQELLSAYTNMWRNKSQYNHLPAMRMTLADTVLNRSLSFVSYSWRSQSTNHEAFLCSHNGSVCVCVCVYIYVCVCVCSGGGRVGGTGVLWRSTIFSNYMKICYLPWTSCHQQLVNTIKRYVQVAVIGLIFHTICAAWLAN